MIFRIIYKQEILNGDLYGQSKWQGELCENNVEEPESEIMIFIILTFDEIVKTK